MSSKRSAYSTKGEPVYERSKYLVDSHKNIVAVDLMLERYGVCIIPNLFLPHETEKMFNNIVKELETYVPGFNFKNVDTWPLIRKAKATHGMILQNFGLGWMDSVIAVRTKKRCISVYSRLYSWLDFGKQGKSKKKYSKWDLFSSADGFAMYLNPDFIPSKSEHASIPFKANRGGYHRKGHDWLHWDQAPDTLTKSFQGFVNMLDPGDKDRCNATFTFLEGSHKKQREFQMHFWGESTDEKEYNPRFFRLQNQKQFDFYNVLHKCQYKALDLKAGDFVLWNSKLIHQGRNAIKPDMYQLKMGHGMKRSVVYVSMQPKTYARSLDRLNKKRAFEQLRTTTHEASYGVHMFTKKPRIYNAEEKHLLDSDGLCRSVTIHPTSKLSALQKSLFGISNK